MRGRARILAVATVAGAGWTAGATAAPIAGDYGGGTIAAGFTYAKTGRFTLIGLRTDPAAGTALVNVRADNRCGVADVVRRVPLAPDGSFTLRATARKRVQNQRFQRKTVRIVVFGRVDGGAGSGNVRARVTYRTRGRIDRVCRIRTQGWQVRVPSAEPAPAAPRAGTVYHGLTSQRVKRPRPIVLRVDRRGRRLKAAVFQHRRACQTGRYSYTNISPGARIRSDGSFARTERFGLGFSNAVEHFKVRMRGQFTPNGVRGTITIGTISRARSDGRVIDRCPARRISFSAHP